VSELSTLIGDGYRLLERNSTLNSSMKSMTPSRKAPKSVAQRKVIRWPTLVPYGTVPVSVAEELTLVNKGIILRTYLLFPVIVNIKPSDITSKLRATLDLGNVRFSVVSIKRTRMLICVSYSPQTLEQPGPKAA
jgi:hypothetical protein